LACVSSETRGAEGKDRRQGEETYLRPCFSNKALTRGLTMGWRNWGIEGNKWCSIW
jgi:hypothetical protein